MDNNMMMFLPLLMSMSEKNGDGKDTGMANMTEMMLNMMKNDSRSAQNGSGQGVNPMMMMMMSMMNNKKPAHEPQNERSQPRNTARPDVGNAETFERAEARTQRSERKERKEDFSAIQDFSGRDVMEALRVLMKNPV